MPVHKILILSLVYLFIYANSALSESKQPQNEKNIKIVMLGDSITAGYGLPQEEAFPAVAEKILKSKGHQVSLLNAGISGSTSASAVARLKWQLRSKPTHVFIALGANDGLRGFDVKTTQQNLEKAIQFCKDKNLGVILAGMKMPPNYGKKYTADFENTYSKLAKKHSVPFFPFLLEGVAGEKDLNQGDGIHPNKEGQLVIAGKIADFLEKLIKQGKIKV